MKTQHVNWAKAILMGCAVSLLQGCSKSAEPAGQGSAEFQITDAPSDDASVKSVFVTVTDVKVDGQSIAGFSKQTIDLKAYQEGNTKLLLTTPLNAKAYSNLTLVLDADADASGVSPGCYVQTTDNTKYKLKSSGTVLINLTTNWVVSSGAKSTVVLDFDIRKAIRAMDNASVRYNFIADDSLQNAVRVVTQTNAGTIHGTYTEQTSSGADKIIVYAYKKGSYNASTETVAQGGDAIFFANAVISDDVKVSLSGNTYTLAFLDAGDYELHFAAYHLDAITNRYTFQSMLAAQTSLNGTVGDFVTIQGTANVSLSSVITGPI